MARAAKVVIAGPRRRDDHREHVAQEDEVMKRPRAVLAAALAVTALVSPASGPASQDNPKPLAAPNLSGLHDFDFKAGKWKARHRRLKERLAGSTEWVEFDGTAEHFAVMDGWANVDDNVFNMPGGAYRGVSLRSYDPKSGQWAIWWLDGRNPFGELDPPVKGRFENGVGTFYADDTLRGQKIKVRFTWSHITPLSARWEQAFSPDGGKTWEVNWVTEFERIS
jgi:hypothetical protein